MIGYGLSLNSLLKIQSFITNDMTVFNNHHIKYEYNYYYLNHQ
jgi:hypothetical protein